jgi:hypothetical protein
VHAPTGESLENSEQPGRPPNHAPEGPEALPRTAALKGHSMLDCTVLAYRRKPEQYRAHYRQEYRY